VFVQMREFDVRLSVVPAAIDPIARSDPPELRVTVLPLDVVDVVGAGAGAGTTRAGVRTVRPDVFRAGVVVRGAGVGATGEGVTEVPAGTSCSAGCTDVSAFAICRSRLKLVSCASVSSFLSPHALKPTAIANASGAVHLAIVLDISPSIFM
jgi:hypothetical protein